MEVLRNFNKMENLDDLKKQCKKGREGGETQREPRPSNASEN